MMTTTDPTAWQYD